MKHIKTLYEFFYNAIPIISVAVALSILFGCSDHRPEDLTSEERIEGSWQGKNGFLEKHYLFNQGSADCYTIFSNQIVYENHYSYTFRQDTLRLVDLIEGTAGFFVVSFPSDTTCELGQQHGIIIKLERL